MITLGCHHFYARQESVLGDFKICYILADFQDIVIRLILRLLFFLVRIYLLQYIFRIFIFLSYFIFFIEFHLIFLWNKTSKKVNHSCFFFFQEISVYENKPVN